MSDSTEVRYYVNQSWKHRFLGGASTNRERQPKITLISAFYNKLDFFRLVFASIESQKLADFELIICDDGSRPEIVRELHAMLEASCIPTQHIWHSDRGFCKNECLNRAVVKSSSDYLVFIDADCVLHPDFLSDHYEDRRSNCVLAGRRMDLSPFVTKRLTVENIKGGILQKWLVPIQIIGILMKDNNALKAIRLKGSTVKSWLWQKWNRKYRSIVGCNFSIFKLDLEKINGFDMTYTEVSFGEDSDIEARLKMLGVEILPFCFRGIQYHLYHKVLARSSKSHQKWLDVLKNGPAITSAGIRELKLDEVFRA